MIKNDFRSDCPISSCLELFGDKWTLLITRDLLYYKERTFKDFTMAEEKISTARLTDRLKKMEGMELITKDKHPTNKKVYIYKLTQKGKALAPVIVEMILWGNEHLEDHISEESKQFAKKLKSDKDGILKDLQK
ncbi:helix-turn-helix domain-containing protein [Flagellimonas sp. CMM7]|uniref:winged helix-turn-helix transcriptional regulator n=1 Tax=Flagellimonas sp. CMM7 TaxID=2654676 RepID=UPI0013D87F8B|nr:helix-turn-helix domain-containing protein [Flagellimonas sp. CMM7]UII78770.1 helix-turn-helix transcriptional regulator [Flagellimonas sp. CMM7]